MDYLGEEKEIICYAYFVVPCFFCVYLAPIFNVVFFIRRDSIYLFISYLICRFQFSGQCYLYTNVFRFSYTLFFTPTRK